MKKTSGVLCGQLSTKYPRGRRCRGLKRPRGLKRQTTPEVKMEEINEIVI